MEATFYYVLHVVAAFALVGFTFAAFAAPVPTNRIKIMVLSGIATLAMVVAGFGLMAKLSYTFTPWLIAKIVCWLILSALSGIAFRRPALAPFLSGFALLVIGVAVYCVYYKPV